MKVVAFTITCNRLDLTKQYINELRDKNSVDIEHIVIDNGSIDGTINWLSDNGFKVLSLGKNYGIIKAMKIAIDYIIKNYDTDLIVKFDNDCLIFSDEILQAAIKFYKENGLNYVLAPDDIAILEHQRPKILKEKQGLRFNTHVGGIFKIMPAKAAKLLLNVDDKRVGGDLLRGRFWRTEGFESVYLMDYKIQHKGIGKQTKNYKLV